METNFEIGVIPNRPINIPPPSSIEQADFESNQGQDEAVYVELSNSNGSQQPELKAAIASSISPETKEKVMFKLLGPSITQQYSDLLSSVIKGKTRLDNFLEKVHGEPRLSIRV